MQIGYFENFKKINRTLMKMKDLTVIVPTYNEELAIKETINKICKYLPSSQIIVVNDYSKDRTLDILKKIKNKNLTIINHKINKGYGYTIKTGLKHTKTKYVGFLDADLTYHPKYLQKLLKLIKKEDLDCAWCDRFSGKNRMSTFRKIGNKLISFVFLLNTKKWINDITCGERVFKMKSLKNLDPSSLPDGLDMITALTKRIVFRDLKYSLIESDYNIRYGDSKLNVVTDFLKMIKNILMEK